MMKKLSNYTNKIGLEIAVMLLILLFAFSSNAQNSSIHLHFVKSKTKKINIKFKLIHNLIVIPGFINGSDTLNFILDTGVSHSIITSLKGSEAISFNFARKMELFGLGSGRKVEAFHSFGNVLELPGVIGFNHNLIILKEEFDYLSQGLGTQVHGLLGYDVFESFVVEVDYNSKNITLYDPKFYNAKRKDRLLKKYESIPMQVNRRKPYINAMVLDSYNNVVDANLLVDSGASHAVSLFQSADKQVELPENSIYTYIGVGLSGDIYGHIGRVKRMGIGDFKFKKPIVTFPEETSIQISDYESDRSGSLGADILKRFTVIFDYNGGEMLLKANSNYKSEFKYNLSGIDVTTPIPDFPAFEISKIRKGSPAWIAGLEEGDQIMSINGILTSEYSLTHIIQLLQSRPGKRLTVGIRRDEQVFSAKFTLEDPIK